MIIKKYGIELHRLTDEDLELVRHHRNSDAIRSKMFIQNEISKEEQRKWFVSINNALNYYFVVIWKGKKVGLIHGKIISLKDKVSTGGVFFWNQDVLATYIPVCTSVIMADLTFLLLEMENSTAVVRDDNNVALKFNESLGYIVSSVALNRINLALSKENYLSCKVRNLVKRITKDTFDLDWKDIQLTKDEIENKNDTINPNFLTKYKSQSKE